MWKSLGNNKMDHSKTLINQIIKQNRLTDFETVRLVNSVKQIELSS